MHRRALIAVCTSDISGQLRGKAFPAQDRERRLRTGLGWTPTNIQITAFRDIADTPFGAFGDLILLPDATTETLVDFADGRPHEHFFLADLLNPDGSPWECCPRTFLRNALATLQQEANIQLRIAFEHEFHYSGGDNNPASSYALRALRQQDTFAEILHAAVAQTALKLESFMPEYGPSQYEITISPEIGIKAADQALVLRELVRSTAYRLGECASFAPLVTPDVVGNGVHIHISLLDDTGQPLTYDAQQPYELSTTAAQFIAGILRHAPAVVALTAPSVISYRRLVPNRWSAAYNNLGFRDREACIRICPYFANTATPVAEQFNFEFRAADATASPYLQLGILVYAGLQGIREQLPAPPVTDSNVDQYSELELKQFRIKRLPGSLDEALQALEVDNVAKSWLPPRLLDAYLRHKRSEIELMRHLSADERCQKYSEVY